MKTKILICVLYIITISPTRAQEVLQNDQSIYKIPKALLAGEGLDRIEQKDTSRTVYQKRVYNGVDIALYMVAIGTGITNEFKSFPLEEFIFWMNGKAVVEPVGEEAFPVYSGDYFVQAKGFNGKWNFVDIGGVHLELSFIAKHRPDSSFKSPMSRALIIDRDVISGVSKPAKSLLYEGPELTVKVITELEQLERTSQERMLHILSGVLISTVEGQPSQEFFPGDFLMVPEAFDASWSTNSIQGLRVIEVFKTKRSL